MFHPLVVQLMFYEPTMKVWDSVEEKRVYLSPCSQCFRSNLGDKTNTQVKKCTRVRPSTQNHPEQGFSPVAVLPFYTGQVT